MKYLLTVAFCILCSLGLQAQDRNWSFELNKISPIDDNFTKSSNGYLDLGVKYQKEILTNASLGLTLNTGFLYRNPDNITVHTAVFQPKLVAELKLPFANSVRVFGGYGYSYMVFYSFDMLQTKDGSKHPLPTSVQSGWSYNLGASYDLSERIFCHFQYDFIKLGEEEGIPHTKYNSHVNLLQIGLGWRV